MSNGLYASSLLDDQEPKVWEYVYLSGSEPSLYYDGYVIANNAHQATEKVIELIRGWSIDFNPQNKVISVRPYGYAVNVE